LILPVPGIGDAVAVELKILAMVRSCSAVCVARGITKHVRLIFSKATALWQNLLCYGQQRFAV